jgi:hypothetical protein
MKSLFSNKKGEVAMGLILLALALAGSYAVWPDYFEQGIPALLSGTPQSCIDDSFSNECLCDVNEERIKVNYAGLNRYLCESTDKFLDPDSSNFENDLRSKAQQEFSGCSMSTCDHPKATFVVGTAIDGDYTSRSVVARCEHKTQQLLFYEYHVNVDDGTNPLGANNYCTDFSENPEAGSIVYDSEGNVVGTATNTVDFQINSASVSKGKTTDGESWRASRVSYSADYDCGASGSIDYQFQIPLAEDETVIEVFWDNEFQNMNRNYEWSRTSTGVVVDVTESHCLGGLVNNDMSLVVELEVK